MAKMKLAAVFLLAALPAFSQSSVVDEARAKIVKQKHDAMVQHAKELLEQREGLEAEMKKVDEKLAKLEKGEDVDMSQSYIVSTSTGWVSSPYRYTFCPNQTIQNNIITSCQ